jgi:hypothetical protein
MEFQTADIKVSQWQLYTFDNAVPIACSAVNPSPYQPLSLFDKQKLTTRETESTAPCQSDLLECRVINKW